jgi:hypothetical protein
MQQMDEPLAKLHLQANKNYLLQNKSKYQQKTPVFFASYFFRYIYMYL